MVSYFIKEICSCDNVTELMINNYGNYVVQKALKLSSINDKNILMQNIIKNLPKMKDKKLNSKWKSILEITLEQMVEGYVERPMDKLNIITPSPTKYNWMKMIKYWDWDWDWNI